MRPCLNLHRNFLSEVSTRPNENKMSCRERGRAWLRLTESWETWAYAGQGVGCIAWLDLSKLIGENANKELIQCEAILR